MKFKERPKPLSLFTKKLQSLVYRLDNTGDSNKNTNGEFIFIKKICEVYKDSEFVLFDVGANTGEYSKQIIDLAPHVEAHLFEPQHTCVSIIKKNLPNHTGLTNPFGLSDTSKETEIYTNTEHRSLASLYQRNLKQYNLELNTKETITLKTGLEYIQQRKIKKVHLLKIDVEGHELKVLKGFGGFVTPSHIDFIQFEYGGTNLDAHASLLEIYDYLADREFIICKIMPHHLEPLNGYEPRFENFVYQNFVAVNPSLVKKL